MQEMWSSLIILLGLSLAASEPLGESYMRRESVLGHHGQVLSHRPDTQHSLNIKVKPQKKHSHKAKAAPHLQSHPSMMEDGNATEAVSCSNPTGTAPTSAMGSGTTDGLFAVSDNDQLKQGFTITFKVKFCSMTPNDQVIMDTDEKSVWLQLLGPHYQGDSHKIAAYVKTDSGLGPSGHGVTASCVSSPVGCGVVLSQSLSENHWYDVKLVKNSDSLKLTVDGTESSGAIDTSVLNIGDITTDFDLFGTSTNFRAGHQAGSGDLALVGGLGDINIVEGLPATPAPTPAASSPAAGDDDDR